MGHRSCLSAFAWLVLPVLFACQGGACGKSGSSGGGDPSRASEGAQRVQVAVIPKGTSHEFWKSVHAGANKAGRALGFDVFWKGPAREDDRGEQIKIIEDMISRGVAGIVVAPLDDTALVPVLKEAKGENIPVVVIDSGIQWDGHLSFVATDNYKGGELAADHLGKLLDGRGKVVVMRYQEGAASTMKREAGFLDTIKKRFPEIDIVSSNQYGGPTTEAAYSTAENLLIKNTKVDGIFCPNESTTFGMLRALQDVGKAGTIRFVGFDSSKKLVRGLEKGEIDGLVIQDPFAMGEQGVRAVARFRSKKTVDRRIDTGVQIATKDNMNDAQMQALLLPDLKRWLR